MRRLGRIAISAAVAVGMALGVATPATAATPRVEINLKGWTIRDKANHTYTFKTNFKLGPGKSVYIHTGKGKNTSRHRYWGRGWYVWNSTGDKAYLRGKAGTLLDTCSWRNGAGYTYCK